MTPAERAEADRLDTAISQCQDVVRATRLALVLCVAVAAVLAGLKAGSWAVLPFVVAVPAAVNLVFHQWQLMKLRMLRRGLEAGS